MSVTQNLPPPLVQMFDYSVVQEYYKRHHGLIFSYSELVRAETIKHKLVLDIKTQTDPEEIYFNGKLVKLTPFI